MPRVDDTYSLLVVGHILSHVFRLKDYHSHDKEPSVSEYIDTCQVIEDKVKELRLAALRNNLQQEQ